MRRKRPWWAAPGCPGRDLLGPHRIVLGEHDTVIVDVPDGPRELTLIGHGMRLVVTDGRTHDIELVHPWPFESAEDDVDTHPASPLPGRVVSVQVTEGERVVAGQPLAVVEGMKMQHTIKAGRDGTVTCVKVEPGDQVEAEAVLFEIDTHR